jgi:hypothetical protein
MQMTLRESNVAIEIQYEEREAHCDVELSKF